MGEHLARCDEMLKFNPVWKMKGLDSLAPVRIRLLKALLALLEVSVPTDALQPYWSDGYRRSWGMQLHMSSSADDLLQAMTTLEGAIKKDFLSPKFQTTNELLASSNTFKLKNAPVLSLRDVPVLPWIPQTTAAVALRLMELDSAVSYTSHQKEEFKKEAEAGDFSNLRRLWVVCIEPKNITDQSRTEETVSSDPTEQLRSNDTRRSFSVKRQPTQIRLLHHAISNQAPQRLPTFTP